MSAGTLMAIARSLVRSRPDYTTDKRAEADLPEKMIDIDTYVNDYGSVPDWKAEIKYDTLSYNLSFYKKAKL